LIIHEKTLVLKTGRGPFAAAAGLRRAGQGLEDQRLLLGAVGPGVVEQMSENKQEIMKNQRSTSWGAAFRAAEAAVSSS
jgi:hypothetical protein